MSETEAEKVEASVSADAAASSGKSTRSGAVVGTAVLVTGNTFPAKEALKAVGGGSWCKPLGGWIFPEDKRASVLAALGEGTESEPTPAPAVASTAAIPAESSQPSQPTPVTGSAGAVLEVSRHKRALLVSGDTMKVKPVLSSLQGRWNGALGGWVFPGSRRDEVVAALRADPRNTVSEKADDGAPAKPPKRTKKSKDEDEFIDDDDDD
mmetsp:Transcript_26160/g.57322  ORF Transcript_26160/g.57322 Transcript_26160/m.57322 type:complete len:209 (+) Transcript_26160:122-748(+)